MIPICVLNCLFGEQKASQIMGCLCFQTVTREEGWAGLGWAGLGTSPIPWSRPATWDTDNGEDTGQGLVMITLTSISWPQFIVY